MQEGGEGKLQGAVGRQSCLLTPTWVCSLNSTNRPGATSLGESAASLLTPALCTEATLVRGYLVTRG